MSHSSRATHTSLFSGTRRCALPLPWRTKTSGSRLRERDVADIEGAELGEPQARAEQSRSTALSRTASAAVAVIVMGGRLLSASTDRIGGRSAQGGRGGFVEGLGGPAARPWGRAHRRSDPCR